MSASVADGFEMLGVTLESQLGTDLLVFSVSRSGIPSPVPAVVGCETWDSLTHPSRGRVTLTVGFDSQAGADSVLGVASLGVARMPLCSLVTWSNTRRVDCLGPGPSAAVEALWRAYGCA